MRTPFKLAAACLIAAGLAQPAIAQESPTLQKIKASGSIALGHRESSIPFSYYDDKQQVVGYSHELMLKVVDAVKAELKLPNLTVKLTPVTSQNRIPLVQNGTVDIECGSTTHNTERARQAAFSNTIFIIGTRLMTKKDSGIKDFPDLAGKNVVTTAGTTSERLLKAMNADQQMGMNIISAKDHGESFLMLESSRAVAFMMDDALLYGEMAKAKKPADWAVVGTPQSFEIYGCMLRKGDLAFKQVVDRAISSTFSSGDIHAIYATWFQQPVPPKGLTLNFPMSAELQKLIANPTDKAAEQL